MWTPEQAKEIRQIALDTVPGIKTHAIPQGMQVKDGPDAVVAYLVREVPKMLDG